jgi:hypothetical protein
MARKKSMKRKRQVRKKESNFFLKLIGLPVIAFLVILIGFTIVSAANNYVSGATLYSYVAPSSNNVSLTAIASGSAKTLWVMFHVKKEDETAISGNSKVLSSEWISIQSGQKISTTFNSLPKSKYLWTIRAAIKDENNNWVYQKGVTFWPGNSDAVYSQPGRFTIGTSPTVQDLKSSVSGTNVRLSVVTKNSLGRSMFTMFFVKKSGETNATKIKKSEWISSRSGDTVTYNFSSLESGTYHWTVRTTLDGVDLDGATFSPYSSTLTAFAPAQVFYIVNGPTITSSVYGWNQRVVVDLNRNGEKDTNETTCLQAMVGSSCAGNKTIIKSNVCSYTMFNSNYASCVFTLSVPTGYVLNRWRAIDANGSYTGTGVTTSTLVAPSNNKTGFIDWFVVLPSPTPTNASSGRVSTVNCAADVKLCPNGSYVARDPQNSCQFKTCPR